MPRSEEQYVGNHRRQQSLVLAMSLLGLLLAIAPRQERALFITQNTGLSAFGAAFPPITVASLLRSPGGYVGNNAPTAYFAGLPGRSTGAAPFGDSPAGRPGGGSGGESPVGNGGPQAPLGDTGGFAPSAGPSGSGGGGGLPFSPASFSPPGSSPAVSQAADTPTPVATSTPTPAGPVVTPTTTPTPVPAVPEPASWLMLLVGFFGAGLVVRAREAAHWRRGAAEV